MKILPSFLKTGVTKYYHKKGYRNFDERWWTELRKSPSIVKHYPEWEKLRGGTTNTLDYGVPWYTFGAIDWLESYLKPEMKVFEYGSGGSTIFYAKRVANVISVEHDTTWYQDVSSKVKEIRNAKVILIEPIRSRNKLASNKPGDYRSANKNMANLDFKEYCTYIDRFTDESFDLVAVDGRARTSCLLEAIPKVKPGGYLLLDNSDRDKYLAGIQLVGGWKRTDFTGPLPYIDDFLMTTIFQKP